MLTYLRSRHTAQELQWKTGPRCLVNLAYPALFFIWNSASEFCLVFSKYIFKTVTRICWYLPLDGNKTTFYFQPAIGRKRLLWLTETTDARGPSTLSAVFSVLLVWQSIQCDNMTRANRPELVEWRLWLTGHIRNWIMYTGPYTRQEIANIPLITLMPQETRKKKKHMLHKITQHGNSNKNSYQSQLM